MCRAPGSNLLPYLAGAVLGPFLVHPAAAQKVEYSSEHRDQTHSVTQTLSGSTKLLEKLQAQRTGVSLAVADLDRDGTPDLITGYATATGGALVLQRGSPRALAPTAAELETRRATGIIDPFEATANAIELPVRPELLLAGDFRGNAAGDALTAQRGDTKMYFLDGDAHGGFAAALPIALRGGVSAVSSWRGADGYVLLVAAVSGASGSGLQFFGLDGSEKGFVAVNGAVKSIENSGQVVNGGRLSDLVLVAEGKVLVLDGDSILTANPNVDTLPVDGAVAVTAGHFVADATGFGQIAALTGDATLHVFARVGLLPFAPEKASRGPFGSGRHATPPRRTGVAWSEVETVAGVGGGNDASPLLLRGHLTATGGDDLAVLAGGQFITLTHPTAKEDGIRKSTPLLTMDSTATRMVAAVAAHISADSREGVVMLDRNATPHLTVPTIHNVYIVSTTTDANDSNYTTRCPANATGTGCSLRDAIHAANADYINTSSTRVDEIEIPAGTYTISVTNGSALDSQGDVNYHYDLDTNVDLVGEGTCTTSANGVATSCPTIINANSKDAVFIGNSGVVNGYGAYSIFMSGLQLENGVNNNNPATTATGAYADYDGGIIGYDSDGTGQLLLNTMVITGGTGDQGAGGGIGLYNGEADGFGGNPAAGTIEIENSTISNNSVPAPYNLDGGALAMAPDENLMLTNDIFSGNSCTGSSGEYCAGGAIQTGANYLGETTTLISVVLTGNTASGQGGGLNSGVVMAISNMTATGNEANSLTADTELEGGGAAAFTDANTTISYSTFSGNRLGTTASAGAGLYFEPESDGTTYTIHYSRIVGNSGGASNSTGLALGFTGLSPAQSTALNATDNWWGCNTDPQNQATNNCNKAYVPTSPAVGTITTTPFTTLALNLSASALIEGNSITATASLGQDSNGTVFSAANDVAYLATPITAFTLTDTGTVTYTPGATSFSSTAATGTSFAAATAAAATNALGTGSATLTVDGFTVTKTYAIEGPPTIAEALSPSTVAPNAASSITFTLGNPSSNPAALTGIAFADTLPSGLTVASPSAAATTCSSGTVTAAAGGSSIALSGATINAGATCTVSVNVLSPSIGSYTNTTGTISSSNGGTGSTASATLTVQVTPTKLIDTASPATPITAGGNAGTVAVALEDASGNIATNNSSTTVTLTVTGPSSYSQVYTATAANGVATFSLSSVALTLAGTYTYVASSGSLTSASAMEVVNPGTGVALSVTGLTTFTAPQMAGTATVAVRDSYGNLSTSFTGTVTLTSSDATATIAPTSYTYTASDAGSHGFTVTFNTANTQTVTATSGGLTGSETGILVEDAIWILNTNNTVARTTDAGVQTNAAGTANGSSTYGAVAFDNAGDVWTVSNASSVTEYTKAGVSIVVPGLGSAGINAPVSLFVDGGGQIWIANTNNSVSVLSNAGGAVSPGTGYQGGAMSTPSAILVDSAGSVWVTNRSGNSVTKIFGAAQPVVAPTVTGTTNNTLGTRP